METAKICFLGDLSFSGAHSSADSSFVDREVTEKLKNSDAVICNFETSISDQLPVGLFQSPKSCLSHIRKSGITHAFIANNHIYDYGYNSFEQTINSLNEAEIIPLGLRQEKEPNSNIESLTLNGVRIGLICCGWTKVVQKSGPHIHKYWEYDETEVTRSIIENRKQYDHLILILHRGKMFVEYPSNKDRTSYLHYIKLGAKAVIGHHPHVVQGVHANEYHLIAFSIGNFFFDSDEGLVKNKYPKRKQDTGIVLNLELSRSELLNHEIIPIIKKENHVELLKGTDKDKFDKRLSMISKLTSKSWSNYLFFSFQYIWFVLPQSLRVLVNSFLGKIIVL